MSEWDKEKRAFEDKCLARLAWENGRNSWCPAGVLSDTERTERDWQRAWSEICSERLPKP